MSMVNDFKRMCEDIFASFSPRRDAIDTIKRDTHSLLNDFRKSHHEMAEEMKKKLSSFRAEMNSMRNEWSTMHQRIVSLHK